jgi:Mrp family chromosome partitioning ATPase
MDRLERALQKAREQRESAAIAQESVAVAAAAVVARTPSPPPPPAITSRKTSVGEKTLEQHRIVSRSTRSPNADLFRILRTKIARQLSEANLTTLAVTSPNYGDGKTLVAVNLALSLALDVKQTVLLVDLDLRDPSVHLCLGIEPEVGLSDYFVDDAPIAQCMVNPGVERLVVLPLRRPIANSSEALGTPKMANLARELKTRYSNRIVIYDMPPILAQDDVIAFLPNVDAALLVVREGVTMIDDVRQCMQALTGANLIGTVLNDSVERTTASE